MTTTTSETKWIELDVDSLAPHAVAAHKKAKALYSEYATAKKAFEALMVADAGLPTSHTLAFGYRFGKLTMAVVPAKTASKSAKAISFADAIKAA